MTPYNNYLFYVDASKGEQATQAEIENVKRLAKDAYDKAQEGCKNAGVKPQYERYIDDYGIDAVTKTGFHDGRYKKPIILRLISVDCYGDVYDNIPVVAYADGIYDFKGLTEDSLRAYSMGQNFCHAASASGGAILLISDGITMESIAEQLVGNHTYTIRPIKRLERPERDNRVFYTVKNGEATDAGIVDEMLSGEKSIRQQLIDSGVIGKSSSRMMTPAEIEAYEAEKKRESDS